MTVDPALLNRLLDAWPVAHLATVAPTGGPHIVPVVFCRDGACLYSPVDGKAKRTSRLQRLRNLAHQPSCTLLLDHYESDWQQLWWVRLDASAEVYVPDAAAQATLSTLLRRKYAQYLTTPLYRDRPTYIRMRWHRVTAWSQGPLTPIISATLDLPR
jgi:PPOX class probable F420-dependent enzyme